MEVLIRLTLMRCIAVGMILAISLLLRSNGNVEIGGSLTATRGLSDPNISLNADGSAQFLWECVHG